MGDLGFQGHRVGDTIASMSERDQAGIYQSGILLFDGECAFCASSVRFILKHERESSLRFAPRNSTAGTELCSRHGIDPEGVKSMILIRDGEVLTHSDAVLAVAGYLRPPWSLACLFRMIPRGLRDGVYSSISRHRQRLSLGKRSCDLPREEWKGRFLG
jgi:predicted DCC family thiol-disulfide oxidoreductase YuxK